MMVSLLYTIDAIFQLDHGAKLCYRCSMGCTALHFAASNASKKVIELILTKGKILLMCSAIKALGSRS